jgi:UDP-N-acetyl-D-galactosamine dehydrogenase
MYRRIGVVGLGYVGLPVAAAFGEIQPVIGFDVNPKRIAALTQGIDIYGELTAEELKRANITYTVSPDSLRDCDFVIVSVPTPIDQAKQPDLSALIQASKTVGENLTPGAIVVYESTVYPGATEEVCLPLLERHSGLRAGKDFFVGYSPERINPGDKRHRFSNIVKVISGQDQATCDMIADVYGMVVEAGVYRAPSIKVAEAAKVIENTQRDINIALINELAILFDRMGIDTGEVLAAAGSKWNFLPFKPGLVGGHCIGVDPYYLTYKAESIGYHPEVILAGRRINDGMPVFIVQAVVRQLIHQNYRIKGAVVTILGLTYKENVADLRNSKVLDIVYGLREFGIHVQVTDPLADPIQAEQEYGVRLSKPEELRQAHAVILAVPHDEYASLGWEGVLPCLQEKQGIVVDLKGLLDPASCPASISLWRL